MDEHDQPCSPLPAGLIFEVMLAIRRIRPAKEKRSNEESLLPEQRMSAGAYLSTTIPGFRTK